MALIALGVTGVEAELWAHRRRSAITRYAKNKVHQNAAADETYVQARVALRGAKYAILDPKLAASRRWRPVAAGRRVLVALGGGPRREIAREIAEAIVAADPRAQMPLL